MGNNNSIIQTIMDMALSASPDSIGDNLTKAYDLALKNADLLVVDSVENSLKRLRLIAANASPGWRIFSSPVSTKKKLSAFQAMQLVGVEFALHEFCYACERIEESALLTWGGSTPTRFYLNSIYYYIASLFLVDAGKKNHKGLFMGGTVILALNPLGLDYLLKPIKNVIDTPFGSSTFGDAVQRLRNRYLVHGDFSLSEYEKLITQTDMRNPDQQLKFRNLVWDLFYRCLILDLHIVSIFTSQKINWQEITSQYLISL